jgi:hypothetical protein
MAAALAVGMLCAAPAMAQKSLDTLRSADVIAHSTELAIDAEPVHAIGLQ